MKKHKKEENFKLNTVMELRGIKLNHNWLQTDCYRMNEFFSNLWKNFGGKSKKKICVKS